MNDIKNFETWTKVTKGYYRYVVAAKACYEILITFDDEKTIIAVAYITGDWLDKDKNYFSREVIYEGFLKDCLEAVARDYEQNS